MAGNGRGGAGQKLTPEELAEIVKAVLEAGSVSGGARMLGIDRRTAQHRLRTAQAAGVTDAPPVNPALPSRWRPFEEIVAARKGEFERVKSSGDGRTLHKIPMADGGPYCLVFLGDPHLDSPGTDLALWERWTNVLNADRHIHGVCIGDYLDNWPRALAHIYGASETPAPEAWILLEGYLEKISDHLLASVGGNHDSWSGYTDLLGYMMKEGGVLHREHSLRLALTSPKGRTITVGLRHKFSGNSQWNPAHAIMKAAQLGWRDNILVGGHMHISGDGLVRCPDTGKLSWCYQIAAFKVVDDYADQLALPDKHVSPAVALVIRPERPDTDPQLVTQFHDPEAAVEYLNFLRGRG